jgi:hypothetical protein
MLVARLNIGLSAAADLGVDETLSQAERFWLRRMITQAGIDPKALQSRSAPHNPPASANAIIRRHQFRHVTLDIRDQLVRHERIHLEFEVPIVIVIHYTN